MLFTKQMYSTKKAGMRQMCEHPLRMCKHLFQMSESFFERVSEMAEASMNFYEQEFSFTPKPQTLPWFRWLCRFLLPDMQEQCLLLKN